MDTFFDFFPTIGCGLLLLPICALLELLRAKLFPPAPPKGQFQDRTPMEKAPPALPARSSAPARGQILDYPKCPIDRCRNEPGQPQVVFRDEQNQCYVCCNGHRFTGRE